MNKIIRRKLVEVHREGKKNKQAEKERMKNKI